MKAILIHGMGRTPLSMWLLAQRLTKAGIQPHCFAYTVTLEKFQPCVQRLQKFIEEKTPGDQYIVVTHSLGSVLMRSASPQLSRQPAACFLLAPPTVACAAALNLVNRSWYKLLTGEMGQLLAKPEFMSSLPLPESLIKIYAGDAGWTGKHSPFGDAPNDGILKVSETLVAGIDHYAISSLHTFIMNNRRLAADIINTVNLIQANT